ncbi:MAG: peptidylprolyl isomerase [Sulfuricella sp.]|jgi:peptidyl-prolyl cis-trans isomerase C|nr:peptidylprolyl isomerase [Sulfuricella sp.]
MMTIKSRILLVSTASLLTLSACNADDNSKAAIAPATAPAAGNVAATVNGTAISKGRLDLLVKQRTSAGQPDSPELRKAIINQLAMQMLISQEAIKKGLDKNPEVIDQIELTKQSILANAFVQDYIKTHPVSDDMLKAEYDKVKAQMTGTEYKARHILVEKEAEAKDIIAKLKKDIKQFDKLAKEKSKDPGSKDKGGELGWFDPRGMVPEFGAAVAKLAKGKITDEPVKTQFGYHVIMLEDSRPMQVPPLDQVKPQLTQEVQQQQLKGLIDDMKSKAKIEITEAPAAPAAPAK